MTIALWIDAAMASLGALILIIGLINSNNYGADERMTAAFGAVIGGGLIAVSFLLFILLTAMKAWS